MGKLPRIAITMGDPAGVGPEIILKAFQNREVLPVCRGAVIGDATLLETLAKRFSPDLQIRRIGEIEQADFAPGCVDVVDLRNVPENLPRGQATAAGGRASVEYIRLASDLAMQGRADAIVTAPINKKSVHLAGCKFPGHTEFLAKLTGSRDFALMMVGGSLRIVLVTLHVSLRQVPSLVRKDEVLRIIRLTHRWLSRFVTKTPRIAVTGLNPHCGEEGIFGEEETESIIPAVQQARGEGIQASGPYPADAFFGRIPEKTYDAVVAMYHDQGLIPVKMLAQGHAVNLTLGLPIIRASVDHGTAYDIAGQGTASQASLVEALKVAAALAASGAETDARRACPTLKSVGGAGDSGPTVGCGSSAGRGSSAFPTRARAQVGKPVPPF